MDKPKEAIKIIEIERGNFKIPECCKTGSPECPHVPQKQKKTKTNPGL